MMDLLIRLIKVTFIRIAKFVISVKPLLRIAQLCLVFTPELERRITNMIREYDEEMLRLKSLNNDAGRLTQIKAAIGITHTKKEISDRTAYIFEKLSR